MTSAKLKAGVIHRGRTARTMFVKMARISPLGKTGVMVRLGGEAEEDEET